MPVKSPPDRSLRRILEELRTQPGVTTALLAASDGLLIARAVEGDDADELWAAVSAVLGNLGGKLTAGLGGGELQSAAFTAVHCQFVVRRVSLGYLLAVAQPEADVEGICAGMETAAREVEAVTALLAPTAREGDEHV